MNPERILSRRAARVFAASNLLSGALLLVLGFVAVKTRFWLVDLPLAAVAALLVASALGLFGNARWSERVLRVAAWAAFVFGLFLVGLMVLTIAFLRGVYGELSGVAMATCGLVVALVVPYVVLMPAVELVWLGRREPSTP